ncbi:MAG TPA: hypothetical protein GX717_03120 [Clostridiaceae bacterium]|nr:hypothetical protein [Clostridiaceae bacterium]
MLWAFLLAIVFFVIFLVLYIVLVPVLHEHLHIADPSVSNILHSGIIALIGTGICSLGFKLRDKRFVPYAFTWLAIFAVLAALGLIGRSPTEQTNLRFFLFWFMCIPVVIGNGVTWFIYIKLKRRKNIEK